MSTSFPRPADYAQTTPPPCRDRVFWVGRSVEPRADARRRRRPHQWPRSARDSGAAYCGAAGNPARRERAADAHGHARCHGDERRDARHRHRSVGSTTPGNAAHPFVLRRWTDAARAGECEGPRDSIRARAGRHGQISARSPDVRPQVSTQSRHRRVHAREGRPVPRRDPSGRNASWRNGLPRLPQGPNQGRGENVLLLVGPVPPAAGDPQRLRRRRAGAAVRPRRQRPLQWPRSARMC